jgi:hypothetical protein
MLFTFLKFTFPRRTTEKEVCPPKKTENEVQCSQKDHSHEDKVAIYIWVTLFTCFYRKQMTMFIFEVTQLQTSFK